MEIDLNKLNAEMQDRIRQTIRTTDTKAKSCAVRAANELRNSAINVLRGQRHGRRYKKPFGKTYYTASAPGEPPAVRTGMLRMSWGLKAEGNGDGTYTAGIYSDVPYARTLEDGSGRAAPRPYRQAIIDMAQPKVLNIFATAFKPKE